MRWEHLCKRTGTLLMSIGSEWGPRIGVQKWPHFLTGSRPETA